MINLTIPIQNSASVLIGDIYVHCEIRFNPRIPPSGTIESISLGQLNSRLQQMGYEIAAEISHKLEQRIKESV